MHHGNCAVRWVVALSFFTSACGKPDEGASAASAAITSPAPSTQPVAPASPGPCKASGQAPVELGKVSGDVHALAQDSTHLYYASWSVYGSRGDIGVVQKDGGGMRALSSLELEPRGLALDADAFYFTSGIRLMKLPLGGGEGTTVVDVFSSQDIALDDAGVYGVPGDYGPYDRVAKFVKKNKDVEELLTGKRPKRDGGPNGFSRIVAKDGKLFITDAGNGRVLRLGRDGGTPKVLATNQDRAYDLVVVGDTVFFTLAKKGLLVAVSVDGGKTMKVASGLVEDARIAAEGDAVFSVFSGKLETDPQIVSAVAPVTGAVTPLGSVPALDPVVALAADPRCVYWAQRKNASETVVFARARRQ